MRAVVLEIKGQYAAVLDDSGTVRKIKNKNYHTGQEISLMPEKTVTYRRWTRTAAAAAVAVIIAGSGLFYASETAFAYSTVMMTVDDAEVEFTLNKRDEVIGVRALNEDGKEIEEAFEVSRLRRRPMEEFIEEMLKERESAEVGQISSKDKDREEILREEVVPMLPEQGEPVPSRTETGSPSGQEAPYPEDEQTDQRFGPGEAGPGGDFELSEPAQEQGSFSQDRQEPQGQEGSGELQNRDGQPQDRQAPPGEETDSKGMPPDRMMPSSGGR